MGCVVGLDGLERVAVKVLGRAGMEGKMGMDVWEIDGEGVSWSRRI